MFWSLESTSSNVQLKRSLFCDISNAEVATPPAFAALPGANKILFSCRYFVASKVVGIFAPSATAKHPFATNAFASSISNSFCVAQGSAISHFTDHTPEPAPCADLPSWYSALLRAAAYSVSLARFTSLISFNSATSIPSGS